MGFRESRRRERRGFWWAEVREGEFSNMRKRMDQPFSLVVASAFYDGPEEGLAFRVDGTVVAFCALADSPLRSFRAFYFRPVSNWSDVQGLVAEAQEAGERLVLVRPEDLGACLAQAELVDQIGIGGAYLDRLNFAPASASDVAVILAGETEAERYRRAHHHLKRYRAMGIELERDA